MLECGFGDLSSNLVAIGEFKSLINPASTVLFLEGFSGDNPSDVTVHIGASKPGFNLFKELFVEDTNGFITS